EAGGAHLHRTGDHGGPCRHRPTERLGERARPFTTGCRAFVHRHREVLAANHRTARAAAGLDRLSGPPELPAAERDRRADPP
ncbi:cryptochrome/photolyase family protein, partial [Kitasatospora sp. NPDC007106]